MGCSHDVKMSNAGIGPPATERGGKLKLSYLHLELPIQPLLYDWKEALCRGAAPALLFSQGQTADFDLDKCVI